MEIKPDRSGGPDGVRADVTSSCATPSAVALTILFQKFLDCGELPDDWKLANTAPYTNARDQRKASETTGL